MIKTIEVDKFYKYLGIVIAKYGGYKKCSKAFSKIISELVDAERYYENGKAYFEYHYVTRIITSKRSSKMIGDSQILERSLHYLLNLMRGLHD